MRFKTQIIFIDVDSKKELDITPKNFVNEYDLLVKYDKMFINEDLCYIIYIFEAKKKQTE